MRIKQIELNGFKSFMGRTVLELRSGVTAIVGPNGCGKSNVVDAIRWVLGEQSPKHLRGGAMEDVIFAGNADQGPLGMAEVSLLLERSEEDLAQASEAADETPAGPEALPPELARSAEVLVTRRLFRSGESEYLINKVACRLKDITELFLGTGIGTRAYAIIEQGRVEQIVNAKPEDMRLFLEEAAGITRFRARKIAAERKMERTRDNLLRVHDVLRELDRQMGSLQRQAKRAEEYHRIKGALRDLDLRVMAARRRTWTAETAEAATELARLHGEEERLLGDLNLTREAGDDARRRRHECDVQLRATEAELTEQRVAASEATARLDALAVRRAELEQRATQVEAEGAGLRERLEGLHGELAALDATRSDLGREEAEAENARTQTQARLDALSQAEAPLELEVESAKDAVVDGVGEEARLRNLAEALHRRRGEIEGQRRQLDEEQRVLGARLEENARGLLDRGARAAGGLPRGGVRRGAGVGRGGCPAGRHVRRGPRARHATALAGGIPARARGALRGLHARCGESARARSRRCRLAGRYPARSGASGAGGRGGSGASPRARRGARHGASRRGDLLAARAGGGKRHGHPR
jgi:chromosome segregation protein